MKKQVESLARKIARLGGGGGWGEMITNKGVERVSIPLFMQY